VSVRLVFMHLCVKKMHWCLKCRKQACNWSSNIDGYFTGHHRPGIYWTIGAIQSSSELKICRTFTLRAFIPSAIRLSINKPSCSPTNAPIYTLTKTPIQYFTYCRINSTTSPASGAGNVSEPRLMLQVGRVREVLSAQISVFLQSERWCWCSYA
jgi:hypothetical protein